MKEFKKIIPDYLKTLNDRSGISRVYKTHQSIGLELADLLDDREHKSLYMRLAKKHSKQKLMEVAKEVAEKKDVKNKGAYFMRVFFGKK